MARAGQRLGRASASPAHGAPLLAALPPPPPPSPEGSPGWAGGPAGHRGLGGSPERDEPSPAAHRDQHLRELRVPAPPASSANTALAALRVNIHRSPGPQTRQASSSRNIQKVSRLKTMSCLYIYLKKNNKKSPPSSSYSSSFSVRSRICPLASRSQRESERAKMDLGA